MGSKTCNGVSFHVYSRDHTPAHVHGKYAGVEVILELREEGIAYSNRSDYIRPKNAKRSDVIHIFNTAGEYETELKRLWRSIHAAS